MWVPGHSYFTDSVQADEFAKQESEEVVTQPDNWVMVKKRVILK